MNSRGSAQLALGLGGFLGQDVTLERLTTLDRSAAANLKALGSAFLGFHLGHDDSVLRMLLIYALAGVCCSRWASIEGITLTCREDYPRLTGAAPITQNLETWEHFLGTTTSGLLVTARLQVTDQRPELTPRLNVQTHLTTQALPDARHRPNPGIASAHTTVSRYLLPQIEIRESL